MHMKKLIGGVSALAMVTAGSASALTFTLADPALKLAQEVDFALTVAGDLPDMEIATQNSLPVGTGYKLIINLTGGAKFGSLNPATVVSAVTGVVNPIVSTGGQGESSVVILFDVNVAGSVGTTNPIDISLPVDLASCGSVSANIVLTNAVGSVIEGGSAALGGNALSCVNAFGVTIAPQGADSVLTEASQFKNFSATKGDTATVGDFGRVLVAIDTTAVGPDLATLVTPANLTSLTYDIEFESVSGIAGVSQVGITPGFLTKAGTVSGTTYSVATGAAQSASSTDQITVTLDGTGVVALQTLTLENAELDLAAGFVDEDATVTGNGVDSITLDGANFGPFDWVGDTSTIATTVFRVTGLKSKPVTFVTLRNSSGSKDGTYPVDLSGKTLSGAASTGSSQLVLTNADIQAAVGSGFGIADVIWSFKSSDAVDVDRLIATGGIVSAFGDTGNSDDSTPTMGAD